MLLISLKTITRKLPLPRQVHTISQRDFSNGILHLRKRSTLKFFFFFTTIKSNLTENIRDRVSHS